jgi:hypothetical protein
MSFERSSVCKVPIILAHSYLSNHLRGYTNNMKKSPSVLPLTVIDLTFTQLRKSTFSLHSLPLTCGTEYQNLCHLIALTS